MKTLYKSKLNIRQTQEAILFLKDTFSKKLSKKLHLLRVSAPIFLTKDSGLNDDLGDRTSAVTFFSETLNENVEIVQSLAKWKRYALGKYNFETHTGLYTDMNAIRQKEKIDYYHSLYVDQWDWEKVILKEDRNIEYLKQTVIDIVSVIVDCKNLINKKFPVLKEKFSKKVFFITSYELENLYPSLTREERENEITRKHKTVAVLQIGYPLKDGKPHSHRAFDYDDFNLNCDILFYNKELDSAIEISSMGIRVDEETIIKQANHLNMQDRLTSFYQKQIIEKKLPYTIGGGIGQSRICLLLLEKRHILEVQASLFDKNTKKLLEEENIIPL